MSSPLSNDAVLSKCPLSQRSSTSLNPPPRTTPTTTMHNPACSSVQTRSFPAFLPLLPNRPSSWSSTPSALAFSAAAPWRFPADARPRQPETSPRPALADGRLAPRRSERQRNALLRQIQPHPRQNPDSSPEPQTHRAPCSRITRWIASNQTTSRRPESPCVRTRGNATPVTPLSDTTRLRTDTSQFLDFRNTDNPAGHQDGQS